MTVDITRRAAEQAKKWQQLSELLRDPEISAFLEKEYSQNGTREKTIVHAPPKPVTTPDYKRGDVIKLVKDVCQEFLPGMPFTALEVQKKMEQRGFKFAAQNPEITVNGALRKLVRKYNVLHIHVQGSGRRASQYMLAPV